MIDCDGFNVLLATASAIWGGANNGWVDHCYTIILAQSFLHTNANKQTGALFRSQSHRMHCILTNTFT
jgi:hypothetical protein